MAKSRFGLVAALLLSSVVAVPAEAAWPERPITFIVPWGAGGGTDAVARMLGTLLEKDLGQPVNVVNRTGGSGVVGHQAISTAKPDGYTIGMVTIEIAMMHWQGLTQLSHKDYTPLGLVNVDPAGLQVSVNSPYKTAKDVVEATKNGKLKASGTGQGGIWHLAAAGMLSAVQMDPSAIQWVPSQGASPALTDLVASGIDITTVSLPEARPMVDAGRVKNLMVMDSQRSALAPDVPTIKEALGVDFAIGTWRGVGAPPNLPADVAETLSAALKRVHQSKEFHDFMGQRGFTPVWKDPAEFKAFMEQSDADLGKIMKSVGLAK
ncbi:tripartite tricarboxylate transporter substrate binding protein [Azospirillum sp. SYSU D00513]|uniref:tripartite tricarboxylate transporter substrate binding protein n=1 Tax=Azospirillum sp. SYSU D00513 TaxID=2812561 RepID=UPI001A96AABB|nr:tripartite tricarboxylate transporter substrate binding protein [Azospirillum sp. SYSU D00513]